MLRNATLRNPFSLPASAAGLLYPASAALLVVLTLVTIVAALPMGSAPSEPVALTSGGKFAERIPGATLAEAAAPAADMRLPIMIHPAEQAAIAVLSSTADTLWNDAVALKTAAVAVRHDRPKLRMDIRRAAEAAVAAPKMLTMAAEAPASKPDDGIASKLLTSARSVWSETTSVGGAMMSHLLPQ